MHKTDLRVDRKGAVVLNINDIECLQRYRMLVKVEIKNFPPYFN